MRRLNDTGIKYSLAWLLHRLSAVYMAIFIFIQIYALYLGPAPGTYFKFIKSQLQQDPWWIVLYLVFIPAVIFHAMNGIYGIITDYNLSEGITRSLFRLLFLIGIVLGGISLYFLLTGFYA